MQDFVHLHVHSEFSLLDGLSKLDKLIAKARSFHMSAVALTDHGAMYGIFKFFLKAKDAGIKPILGCEIYFAENSRFDKQKKMGDDQYHLTLLASSFEGYQNLLKIVSVAHLDGFHYKPRVDLETLQKYNGGLVALTGCMGGIVPKSIMHNEPEKAEKWLRTYIETFGEKNIYMELQRHPDMRDLDDLNIQLIKLARRYAVPLVATNDVHYLEKDDAYAQEILLCIQTRNSIMEKNRGLSMIDIPDYYFKSPDEMKAQFADLPEAIDNTVAIAERCNVEIPNGKWILPQFEVPVGETVDTWLPLLTRERIVNRFSTTNAIIDKRINYELEVIIKKGYAGYFLIVQDFVNWAKQQGIAVGPGRGSAAGSIVAYILGITELNPIEHNLPFERFLNPERPTPPDIDIDFADTRREEVIKYVTHKYGEDKVAQIITFGTMEARMVLRDVARALGWSYMQGDRLAKLIPPGKQGFNVSIDQALEESSELLHLYKSDEKTKELIDISKKLEGLVRHSSVHAAGVVVADKPLTEYVPIQREAKAGKIVSQYDMYCLDLNAVSDGRAVGLLKFDFLGLRNLSILERALVLIRENRSENLIMSSIPFDDKKTYELIARGETVGVFQLESRGMRNLAKDIKPTMFTDISAMVALFRPGPMSLIPQFIEGKKNASKIKYLHPDLVPILSETYGILVYQEQVTEIAHRLAGFSMSQADLLRMAMGKKKKSLMEKGKVSFFEGCLKRGYPKKTVEQLYEFIEKFAAYGFNKAHSASYATIAYWTAYVKTQYPVEFMTALITAEIEHATGSDRDEKVVQVLEECRRMELPVLPPDINASKQEFSIEGQKIIRFGLGAVKNVGGAAIETMLHARSDRPFASVKDFLIRVDLRKVNKKTIESLIKAGAFDQFGTRAALLAYYSSVIKEIQSEKVQVEAGQFGLFGGSDSTIIVDYDILPQVEEYSEDEKLAFEREVIGFNLSVNPLAKYAAIMMKKKAVPIAELKESAVPVLIGGLIKAVKKIVTKKSNEEMVFVTVTDYTGEIELVVFPKVYARSRSLWVQNQIILAKGKVQRKEDNLVLLADEAISLKLYDTALFS